MTSAYSSGLVLAIEMLPKAISSIITPLISIFFGTYPLLISKHIVHGILFHLGVDHLIFFGEVSQRHLKQKMYTWLICGFLRALSCLKCKSPLMESWTLLTWQKQTSLLALKVILPTHEPLNYLRQIVIIICRTSFLWLLACLEHILTILFSRASNNIFWELFWSTISYLY